MQDEHQFADLLPPSLPPPNAAQMRRLRNKHTTSSPAAASADLNVSRLEANIDALEAACAHMLAQHPTPSLATLHRPSAAENEESSSSSNLIAQLAKLQAQLSVVKQCMSAQQQEQQQQEQQQEQRAPAASLGPMLAHASSSPIRKTTKVVVCSPYDNDAIAARSGFEPVARMGDSSGSSSDEEEFYDDDEEQEEEEEEGEEDFETGDEEMAEVAQAAKKSGAAEPAEHGSARAAGAATGNGSGSFRGGRRSRRMSGGGESVSLSEIAPEDIEQLEVDIEDPDVLFDRESIVYGRMARVWDAITGHTKGGRKKPSKSMAIQLNDPMCDPNTLIYCIFRYRRNRPLVVALLEKLEESQHPDVDSYSLHLCYLLLLEPLAAPLEQWLVMRSRTSLHFALQVYWFCQGMIDDHDPRPGPANYKRFLRIQREVQTGVGSKAEEKASSLMDDYADQEGRMGRAGKTGARHRKGKLRSLEATNRALADAIELRSIFHDATRFVEQLAAIGVTLRGTEPRSERDNTLLRELQALQATLPEQAHLPGRVAGTFQKVLAILPLEAKSYSQREKNP